MQSRAWRDGAQVAQDFPLEELDVWLATPEALVWLDLCQPEPDLLAKLAEELGFDPHAVEDALAPRERPKATRHASHLFFTCYTTDLVQDDAGLWELATSRVSAFVVRQGLITVRDGAGLNMAEVLDRWTADGLLRLGVGGLVHGLLDTIVDGHFDTIQTMDDALEGLEDLLFDEKIQSAAVQQRVFGMRKALVQLRRIVLPMREVVASIQRMPLEGMPRALEGYYTDLYDHVIRASEWTESLRDMVTSVFETNLSLQDSRLNTIMKKLAGWGAIIAIPTAVTGWFGQNVPYPGYSEAFGLYQSAALITVGTVGLFFLFRKFDWL